MALKIEKVSFTAYLPKKIVDEFRQVQESTNQRFSGSIERAMQLWLDKQNKKLEK
jgi:hypothetical protein